MKFLCVVQKNLQHCIDTKLVAAKNLRQFVSSSVRQFVSNSSFKLKKYFFLFWSILSLSLSACNSYMDVSLEEINKTIIPAEPLNLKNPEFFVGEVVTTTNGSVVKGIFGETSEKKVLSNNVVIEGAFYE